MKIFNRSERRPDTSVICYFILDNKSFSPCPQLRGLTQNLRAWKQVGGPTLNLYVSSKFQPKPRLLVRFVYNRFKVEIVQKATRVHTYIENIIGATKSSKKPHARSKKIILFQQCTHTHESVFELTRMALNVNVSIVQPLCYIRKQYLSQQI